jgi:flagellar motor switch protein FliN/FliY
MNNIFTPLEISAIGEITNISLGSSATAISNLLDHRVDITTPSVSIVNAEEFELGPIEPAIGVEIKYVSGLTGSNIMLLKMCDIKVIVDILMGMETPDEEFTLNELTLSAVCEVMNQMMGAASTALSDFLGRSVNISTPETFDLDDLDEFKNKRLPVPKGPIVIVKFALDIEPSLKSEFMSVMSVELAKELIAGFGLESSAEEPEPASTSSGTLSQEEIERLMAGGSPAAAAPEPAGSSGGTLSQEEIEKLMAGGAAQSAPAPAAPAASSSGGTLSQEEIEKLMAGGAAQSAPAQPAAVQQPPAQMPPQAMPAGQPPMQMPQYPYPPMQGQPDGQYPYYYMPPYGWAPPPNYPPQAPEPKVISTQTPSMPNLSGEALGEEQAQNLDLIMSVPLEITVEIGRAKRKVQDILSFAKGSLVVLDKLAGDQVDLFVNGKCIARGEVVVIDDNFGIRIGEILHKPDLEDISAAQK